MPGAASEAGVRAIGAGTRLPLNVLVLPGMAPVAELARWGVRRVHALRAARPRSTRPAPRRTDMFAGGLP